MSRIGWIVGILLLVLIGVAVWVVRDERIAIETRPPDNFAQMSRAEQAEWLAKQVLARASRHDWWAQLERRLLGQQDPRWDPLTIDEVKAVGAAGVAYERPWLIRHAQRRVADSEGRYWLSIYLMELYAKRGKVQAIWREARQITHKDRRAFALASAGARLWQQGNHAEAQRCFAAAIDLLKQSQHLRESDGYRGALQALARYSPGYEDSFVLSELLCDYESLREVAEEAIWYNTPVRSSTNWIELNLDALQHNAQVVQRFIGERTLWAVVKADAYGHGAVSAVRALLQAGVKHFIVASLNEAIELREAFQGQPFRLMTLYPPTDADEWRTAAEYEVECVVDSVEGYQQACAVATALGQPLPVHLEIDTGMSRLGLTPEQAESFLQAFCPDTPLLWQSVFTHFACADSDPEFTAEQLRLFLQVVQRLRAGGFPQTPLHAAASAGMLTAPDSLLDAVRCGLLLYGIAPSKQEAHPLSQQVRPVLCWRARVISLREIPKGRTVSYGALFRATRPTRIATLGVGYADGYPIGLTNRAPVAIRGKLVPQVGRVAMDMIMVDVTDLPTVQVGDIATLIGRDGDAEVRVETLARLLNTTPHEITTRLGTRAKSALRLRVTHGL